MATGVNDIVLVQDQATSGSSGPTYTADAWRTVPLDTEVIDTGSIATLGSNQITLAAGSYQFWFEFCGGANSAGAARGRGRLYNASDTAVVEQGTNNIMAAASNSIHPNGFGQFTIATSKAFEIQFFPKTNNIDENGAMTTGEVEVYAQVMFRRYAT